MVQPEKSFSTAIILKCVCYLLLMCNCIELTTARPFRKSTLRRMKSGRKMDKLLQSRIRSRSIRDTHGNSAWMEVYLHSGTGYNLAVNSLGQVYGAQDFTTDCK